MAFYNEPKSTGGRYAGGAFLVIAAITCWLWASLDPDVFFDARPAKAALALLVSPFAFITGIRWTMKAWRDDE